MFQFSIGKRISIVNAFVINLETRLPNDDGYGNHVYLMACCIIFKYLFLHLRQSTVSPILSTQLADTDLEVTRVNLRNDTVELRINFTMVTRLLVCLFIAVHCVYLVITATD